MTINLSPNDIDAYKKEGAVCLRGIFKDWVEIIAAGIDRNIKEPGPFASEVATDRDTGSFFDDYCNWQRIPEFRDVVENSPAAELAAIITKSSTAQIFHEHVLVKAPGTSKATPWHQDYPYYFVAGKQLVSFWIPIDPVKDATLRCIAGSHHWERLVLPVRWVDDSNFFVDEGDYLPVPDPEKHPDRYEVLEWEMEPGDVVAFDYRTVHGARANMNSTRRRAFSLRWIGDDGRYATPRGPTSPPFSGHGMKDGQRLRADWFPLIWPR